ncbi:MAG: FAD-dependent oxidoreductase [Candidatus Paceibacterota bacterium]
MEILNTETLIIGGGPAGMAAAMELSKAKKDFILVEKASVIGGLSKTYTFKEADGLVFHTDNGPHRFFSKNPYLYEFIGGLLKEDWIKVIRHTRQYIDGKYYDYPINPVQALKNIGIWKAIRVLVDYFIAKIIYLRKPITSFEDYVVSNFGRTLGEFNMINYTEKIWGIPASTIHPDWGKQRIKGLNLRVVAIDAIRGLLTKRKTTAASLVDAFYYPRMGTGQIYETIKVRIEEQGYKVLLDTEPIVIGKKKDNFIITLKDKSGKTFEVHSKYLVESIPLDTFVKILDKKHQPERVLEASKKLRYRSQVYLFITLNKPLVSDNQWIYFPSKNMAMGRVSEMRNFSPYMSPEGKTSLFIEFFCFEGDQIWNMSKEKLVELILPDCEKADLFKNEEIRSVYRITDKNTYPIYDLVYEQYLDVVKNYLNKIPNLFYIGRPGRFRYNNQDHSLEMGMLAAKSIIDGKAYDIESVGQEKDYFEKGDIQDKGAAV